jgi:uncharacterized protein YggE
MTQTRSLRRPTLHVRRSIRPFVPPHTRAASATRPALVRSHKGLILAAVTASALALASLFPAGARAQGPTPGANMQPTPHLNISARGEVQVTPDVARVTLGVETDAKTAQEAAQANATLQTRIIEAVRRAGIPAASIRTAGYNVSPRQQFNPETRTWRVDGYQVTNLVVVVVEPVGKAGEVIDAALSAGANRVASLNFEVKDATSAREQAMTQAVERARRDAELVAKAAGGRVAGLLELSVSSGDYAPRPMMEVAMMRADAAQTPISEGTQSVTVSVTTRWAFQPAETAPSSP